MMLPKNTIIYENSTGNKKPSTRRGGFYSEVLGDYFHYLFTTKILVVVTFSPVKRTI